MKETSERKVIEEKKEKLYIWVMISSIQGWLRKRQPEANVRVGMLVVQIHGLLGGG